MHISFLICLVLVFCNVAQALVPNSTWRVALNMTTSLPLMGFHVNFLEIAQFDNMVNMDYCSGSCIDVWYLNNTNTELDNLGNSTDLPRFSDKSDKSMQLFGTEKDKVVSIPPATWGLVSACSSFIWRNWQFVVKAWLEVKYFLNESTLSKQAVQARECVQYLQNRASEGFHAVVHASADKTVICAYYIDKGLVPCKHGDFFEMLKKVINQLDSRITRVALEPFDYYASEQIAAFVQVGAVHEDAMQIIATWASKHGIQGFSFATKTESISVAQKHEL